MEHDEEPRQPWESGGDLPWQRGEGGWQDAAREAWRGDVHLSEWPEGMAGPEYWLFKRLDEGDEA